MKKLRLNGLVLAAVIASSVFLTWSCGGGGGGETPASQPNTPASMDQTTAEKATAMGMSLDDISDISDLYLDEIDLRAAGPDSQGALSLAAWVMENIREGFLAGNVVNEKNGSRAGSGSESGSCSDSGTYTISGAWSGPDDPRDECDVSNATVTFAFSNCREYGDSANGKITVHVNGNLCAPTAISINFSGFSMTDNSSGLTVEANHFDMAMTALQFSGDDLTHVKNTLNGDIALNSLNMKFSQFNEDMTFNGSAQTIAISGSISGDCLDGWVTFTTLSPIQANDDSECPVGGMVRVSGDTDMVVSFHGDGSMTIGDQTYASCNDLPETCQ